MTSPDSHCILSWVTHAETQERGQLQTVGPIQIHWGPSSSRLLKSMTEQLSAVCLHQRWVAAERRRVKKKGRVVRGGGRDGRRGGWHEEKIYGEGCRGRGGGFITTQYCPGEVREEGWGQRGKTFPFPFLSFAYIGATQGVESFVSLLAGVEVEEKVVFCWKEFEQRRELVQSLTQAFVELQSNKKSRRTLCKQLLFLDSVNDRRGRVWT